MKRATRAPHRRRFSWPVSIALVAGLFVAGLVVPYLLHALLFPWAASLNGDPTLTGYWQGQVTFPEEDRRRVVMELRSDPYSRRCSSCPDIDGEVRVCGAGRPIVYEVWGHVADHHATRFSLTGRLSGETPARPAGKFPSTLDGQWPGGDAITVTATDSPRPSDGPARFRMSRVTETAFTTAC